MMEAFAGDSPCSVVGKNSSLSQRAVSARNAPVERGAVCLTLNPEP